MIKKLFALMLGAVLLAFVFTGCGKEPATETINKAITKNADTKTVHTDYDVSFEIKGDASALGTEYAGLLPMTMAVKGGLDTDRTSEPAKMKGDIQITGIDKIMESLAQAGGESMDQNTKDALNQFSGVLSGMEFVSVDKNAYIKIAGSWYETGDLGSSMDSLGSLGSLGGLGSMGTDASDVNTKCYEDAMKDPTKMGADNLFKETQEMSEEKIDGTNTRHFKAKIDFDKVLTQMGTISKDCGDTEASAGLETAKTDVGKMFSKAEVEMWIDKDSNLRQMKMTIEMDPASLSSLASGLSSGSSGSSDSTDAAAKALESISFNMAFKFSKFNESMDITRPSGTIMKMEDLMNNPMLSGLLSGMGSSGASSGTGSDSLGGSSSDSSTDDALGGTSTITTPATPSYSG